MWFPMLNKMVVVLLEILVEWLNLQNHRPTIAEFLRLQCTIFVTMENELWTIMEGKGYFRALIAASLHLSSQKMENSLLHFPGLSQHSTEVTVAISLSSWAFSTYAAPRKKRSAFSLSFSTPIGISKRFEFGKWSNIPFSNSCSEQGNWFVQKSFFLLCSTFQAYSFIRIALFSRSQNILKASRSFSSMSSPSRRRSSSWCAARFLPRGRKA